MTYERTQLQALRSRQAELSRELEQCQRRIAEYEGKGVDSRLMPQRRVQRDLRDNLAIIGKKIERQMDAVVSTQKHQDEWYAMRTAAHRAWGFAIGNDYLAEGVDPDRWRQTLIETFGDDPSKCALALNGLELLNGTESCDAAAREDVRELWGQAVERALMNSKILAEDLIELLKLQLTGESRRQAIIAVHQLIEHSPPCDVNAETALYEPAL